MCKLSSFLIFPRFRFLFFSTSLDVFICHRMRAMICTTGRPLPSSWSMLISAWFLGNPILRECLAVQGTGMSRYDWDDVCVAQYRENGFNCFSCWGHSYSGSMLMLFGTAWYSRTVVLEVPSSNISRHRIGTQGASVHLPTWYCLGLVYSFRTIRNIIVISNTNSYMVQCAGNWYQ